MTDLVSALGVGATAYSLAAGSALLLQVRTMSRRRSSCDVSLVFLATTGGGYLIWLLYGVGIGSLPLIVSDAIGLACSLVTVAVAVRLRDPRAPRRSVPRRAGHSPARDGGASDSVFPIARDQVPDRGQQKPLASHRSSA